MLYFEAHTRTAASVSQKHHCTIYSTVINKKIRSDYLFPSSEKNALQNTPHCAPSARPNHSNIFKLSKSPTPHHGVQGPAQLVGPISLLSYVKM